MSYKINVTLVIKCYVMKKNENISSMGTIFFFFLIALSIFKIV